MGIFDKKEKESAKTTETKEVIVEATKEQLEGIQTTFNEDGMDLLCEDAIVENEIKMEEGE